MEGIEERYKIEHEIGRGNFSTVYAAMHKATKRQVAIKVIEKNQMEKNRIESEIRAAKAIDHPGIASVFEITEGDGKLCIVSELISGVTLAEYISSAGPLDERVAKDFFEQILAAVEYLHNECKIVHRDLKCENIMVDNTESVRLIDFGFCAHLDDTSSLMHTRLGSPAYVSPEIVMGKPYTSKTDIWSLGIILYNMLTGRIPFVGESITGIMKKIVHDSVLVPLCVSDVAADLILGMLRKDPADRLEIPEIRKHSWLNRPNGNCSHSEMNIKELLKTTASFGVSEFEVLKGFNDSSFDPTTAVFRILRCEMLRRSSMPRPSIPDTRTLPPLCQHIGIMPVRSQCTKPDRILTNRIQLGRRKSSWRAPMNIKRFHPLT